MVANERVPLTRAVMAAVWPLLRWWGRLQVVGEQFLPASGPTLLRVSHDSAWDPLIVGVSSVRRRQVRALARSSLWRVRPVGWVLDRMGQIPIDRGRGDGQALEAAIEHLRDGGCIGVFPEGTVSRGRPLPARSGAGRLALAVQQARVVCVVVTGAVDIVRFPKRPRIRLEFFDAAGGRPRTGESAIGVTKRMMAEVRAAAPYAIPGRRRNATRYRLAVEAYRADRHR